MATIRQRRSYLTLRLYIYLGMYVHSKQLLRNALVLDQWGPNESFFQYLVTRISVWMMVLLRNYFLLLEFLECIWILGFHFLFQSLVIARSVRRYTYTYV